MKRSALLFTFGFFAFLAYLLFYAFFLVLEREIGGGQAYLLFLTIAPILFVIFSLGWGVFCFLKSKTAIGTTLVGFVAFLTAVTVFFVVDGATGRRIPGEFDPVLLYLEIALLLSNPLLTYTGCRVVRGYRKMRSARALRRMMQEDSLLAEKSDTEKKDNTNEPKEES